MKRITRDHITYVFSRGVPPVLEIESGDEVRLETHNLDGAHPHHRGGVALHPGPRSEPRQPGHRADLRARRGARRQPEMCTFLHQRLGLSRTDAFMLISACGDVRIGQAANCPLDTTVRVLMPKVGYG